MGCGQSAAATTVDQQVEVIKRSSTKELPPAKQNFFEHYSLGKKLGAGAFAQVRVAVAHGEEDFNSRQAVKIIDIRQRRKKKEEGEKGRLDMVDPDLKSDTKNEAAIWRKVTDSKNPYCIKLCEVIWDNSCAYFVMERCDVTLLHELERSQDLTELKLGKLFQHMALAISGLHLAQICHRDIKPDNFMVNEGGRVKLGDYGLSTTAHPTRPMTECYGTAPFMSPEMLKDKSYGLKTDIWSFGSLIYVLVLGQFPYSGAEKSSKAMKMAIAEGRMLPTFAPARKLEARPSDVLVMLLKGLLNRDPAHRPSSAEVLAHPYWFRLTQPGAFSHGSWHATIASAKKAGAFSPPKRGKDSKDDTDMLLSELSRQSTRRVQKHKTNGSLQSMSSMQRMESSEGSMPRYRAQMGSSMSECTSLGSPGHGSDPACKSGAFSSRIGAAGLTASREQSMSPSPSLVRSTSAASTKAAASFPTTAPTPTGRGSSELVSLDSDFVSPIASHHSFAEV